MNALIIEATEFTPGISFDPGTGLFELLGESRPEDVRAFYDPVINWLEEFRADLSANPSDGKKYEIKIILEYFNSTSAKFVLDVLMKIDDFVEDGHNFEINWHYEPIDEDMRDSGEEFDKLTTVPFKFTEI